MDGVPGRQKEALSPLQAPWATKAPGVGAARSPVLRGRELPISGDMQAEARSDGEAVCQGSAHFA